jgi:hypothetical protein
VPVVFVTPVVEADAVRATERSREADGSQIGWPLEPDVSLASRTMPELQPGEFVGRTVRDSQLASTFDQAWIFGRHGRVSLDADGLLADPSVFAALASHLTDGMHPPVEKEPAKTAQAFASQLHEAARKLPAMRGRTASR